MGNTVTLGRNVIQVVPDGSADFDITTIDAFIQGVKLEAIKLKGAASDRLIVREGSATGAVMTDMIDPLGDGIHDSFRNMWCRPYIKASDCTFSSPSATKIIFIIK